MKKTTLILLALGFSLNASNIDFKQAPATAERIMPTPKNSILSYHSVLEKTTPSIVHISTQQKLRHNPQMENFLRDFFGRNLPRSSPQKRSSALGSGVILSQEGYIITNNHVIDNAQEITVTLPKSAKEYKATLIGTDPKTDLAIIKIDTKDELIPILLGNSSDLKVGDVVFAIGNPFGVGQSVTQGIVSAQHKNGIGINEYENFIQTDASINPGNSGGALIDSRGALIGINSAILSRSGGNNGIGFAIAVNMVKDVVQKLIQDGEVKRGYLGVQISNITANLQNLYKQTEGALIIDVAQNTPAHKAGLQRGDLITKVDGHSIKSASDLKNKIGMLAPETNVKIEYERNKKLYSASLKLENQNLVQNTQTELLGGLTLTPLNENVRYQYRIPSHVEGLLISGVKQESEAERQGVQEGDIIIQIEEHKTDSIQALTSALSTYKNQYKRIYINRRGRIFMVALL